MFMSCVSRQCFKKYIWDVEAIGQKENEQEHFLLIMHPADDVQYIYEYLPIQMIAMHN